jgi:hypothetical protein
MKRGARVEDGKGGRNPAYRDADRHHPHPEQRPGGTAPALTVRGTQVSHVHGDYPHQQTKRHHGVLPRQESGGEKPDGEEEPTPDKAQNGHSQAQDGQRVENRIPGQAATDEGQDGRARVRSVVLDVEESGEAVVACDQGGPRCDDQQGDPDGEPRVASGLRRPPFD